MKGILTDCRTGEDREIYVDYKIVEIHGDKIFQLVNGPTGYESFYIESGYTNLEAMFKHGWNACAGTKDVYDKLLIPAEEMRNALAPFLKATDEKVTEGIEFELRRQIHELRTDAVIMETALRAYENMVEKRDDRIDDLETELAAALQGGEP